MWAQISAEALQLLPINYCHLITCFESYRIVFSWKASLEKTWFPDPPKKPPVGGDISALQRSVCCSLAERKWWPSHWKQWEYVATCWRVYATATPVFVWQEFLLFYELSSLSGNFKIKHMSPECKAEFIYIEKSGKIHFYLCCCTIKISCHIFCQIFKIKKHKDRGVQSNLSPEHKYFWGTCYS